jgi:hypothetical protein
MVFQLMAPSPYLPGLRSFILIVERTLPPVPPHQHHIKPHQAGDLLTKGGFTVDEGAQILASTATGHWVFFSLISLKNSISDWAWWLKTVCNPSYLGGGDQEMSSPDIKQDPISKINSTKRTGGVT